MPATLSFNGVSFDPDTGVLGGAISRPCRLPRHVCVVLAHLMRAAPRVVRREFLVDAMWGGRDDGPSDTSLGIAIHRLRRDLAGIEAPMFIMNEWGVGYRLATDRQSMHIRCPHCGERLDDIPAAKNFAQSDHGLLTEPHATVTDGSCE